MVLSSEARLALGSYHDNDHREARLAAGAGRAKNSFGLLDIFSRLFQFLAKIHTLTVFHLLVN